MAGNIEAPYHHLVQIFIPVPGNFGSRASHHKGSGFEHYQFRVLRRKGRGNPKEGCKGKDVPEKVLFQFRASLNPGGCAGPGAVCFCFIIDDNRVFENREKRKKSKN
jgi:hypothetical protein